MLRSAVKKSNVNWVVIFFIINPFLALLTSIYNYSSTISKNVVWLFCGFYGYTFYPIRDTMDSFRHRQDFVEWATATNMNFDVFRSKLFSGETNIIDILLPLLKFLVSRVTSDPSIFYGILGLIFGFFFSRNIWFLLSYAKKKLGRYETLFIFIFAMLIAPWEINSFRFWVGAHVFAYYIFRILVLQKKQYIAGLLVTPFIHFGFIISLAVFFIYLAIGNRLTLYFALLGLAFFMNTVNLSFVQSLIPATSIEVINKRADNYTSEGYIEERAEGIKDINWYVGLRTQLLYGFTIIIAFLLFYYKRKEIEKSQLLPLLCFAIFFMAIGYAAMKVVPTFGRYFRLSLLLFYGYFFLLFLQQKNKWYHYVYFVHLPMALFFFIIETRVWFDTATIDTFVSNPVVAYFYQSYEPLINFIKGS